MYPRRHLRSTRHSGSGYWAPRGTQAWGRPLRAGSAWLRHTAGDRKFCPYFRFSVIWSDQQTSNRLDDYLRATSLSPTRAPSLAIALALSTWHLGVEASKRPVPLPLLCRFLLCFSFLAEETSDPGQRAMIHQVNLLSPFEQRARACLHGGLVLAWAFSLLCWLFYYC